MGENFPQVSPMVSVWGPRQAGAVVAQVFAEEDTRAVGESDVVFAG